MNIAIVSRDPAAIQLLETMLVHAKHAVRVHADADVALRSFESAPPDCLVTDWLMPGMDGIELTRRVKRAFAVPVVLMSDVVVPQTREHALRAGAQVFLPKPILPHMVVTALTTLRKASAELAAVAEPLPTRLVRSPFWGGCPALVAEWLRGATGRVMVKVNDARFQPSASDFMASLSMADLANNVEIHLSLRVGMAAASALSHAMIGIDDVDAAGAFDLLSELCNTTLGCAKVNLAKGGFDLVLGTPDPSRPQTPPPPPAEHQRFVLAWDNFVMHVTVSARKLPFMLVPASALEENMIVVEDLKSPQGALLVPAGTRLSAVVAERVTRYLDETQVRVAAIGM